MGATNMNRLAGKVVVVTGAARGLGLAIATRFAEEGARIVLADVDGDAVEAAADKLGQHGLRVDVSQRDEVERMIATATQQFGAVDVLVNNAGMYRNIPLQELTEAEFDRMITVNLKSALFGIQAVAAQMIARRCGSIVNVASIAARLGAIGTIAYAVAKAGVAQLTNVAAIELAPHNVRVNALAPGTFATEMSGGAYADSALQGRVLPRIPMGRMGRPEEAAGVALFLACDDSSYVTGKTIYADGGRMGLNLTM
jgi:glucose 1-dehydrogenase